MVGSISEYPHAVAIKVIVSELSFFNPPISLYLLADSSDLVAVQLSNEGVAFVCPILFNFLRALVDHDRRLLMDLLHAQRSQAFPGIQRSFAKFGDLWAIYYWTSREYAIQHFD